MGPSKPSIKTYATEAQICRKIYTLWSINTHDSKLFMTTLQTLTNFDFFLHQINQK